MIRYLFWLVPGLLLASNAAAVEKTWLLRPADPLSANTPPHYTSVTGGVRTFRVVEPKDWRALNKAVAPKGAGQHEMPSTNHSEKKSSMKMNLNHKSRKGTIQ